MASNKNLDQTKWYTKSLSMYREGSQVQVQDDSKYVVRTTSSGKSSWNVYISSLRLVGLAPMHQK